MKRLLLVLLAILGIGSIYLTSCKKEKIYSCDEGLNDYATITMAAHQGISRDSLAKFGLDTQYAIMASLSSGNKARILKEKIAALVDDGSVTNDDKIHLQKLYDYISATTYENEHPGQDTFLNNWKVYAYDSLHWDQQKMEIYLYTWLIPSEFERAARGYVQFTVPDKEGGGSEPSSCNCVSGYLCETILRKTCLQETCKKVRNCGFLWNELCWGRCSL